MVRLYVWWLKRLSAADEAELTDRCVDGSACTGWCVMVRHQIDTRNRKIARLLRHRISTFKGQRA